MGGIINLPDFLKSTVAAHLASSLAGVTLLAMVPVTFALAVVGCSGSQKIVLIAVNSSYLLLIFLMSARYQAIHGLRYFVFIDLFLIVFNVLSTRSDLNWRELLAPLWLRSKRVLGMSLVALAAWTSFDLVLYSNIAHGRAETYRRLDQMRLGRYEHRTCIAYDVGAFGYFTKCEVLDLSGLVNGRAGAQLTPSTRIARALDKDPVLAFLNAEQLAAVSAAGLKVETWTLIGRFETPNLGRTHIHHLLMRRELAG